MKHHTSVKGELTQASVAGLRKRHLVKRNRGFTLLLAAVISSVVLSIGASIFILARKEVTLSGLGRDSQYAFYAADQAAECALYWDSRVLPYGYFASSTPAGFDVSTLKCDGQCLRTSSGACAHVNGRASTYPYVMSFQYQPTSAGVNYCANVYVQKCDGVIGTWNPQTNSASCTPSSPAVIHTTIHADGYNTSCATIATNPRALQRSVELHY